MLAIRTGRTLRHPFTVFDELRRELDQAFGELDRLGRNHGAPRLVVKDEGDAYQLTLDVPGVRAEDLDVQAEARSVRIQAKRAVNAPEGAAARWQERSAFDVVRQVALRDEVDAAQANAQLEHGVLTLRLPKAESARPRRIEVRAN